MWEKVVGIADKKRREKKERRGEEMGRVVGERRKGPGKDCGGPLGRGIKKKGYSEGKFFCIFSASWGMSCCNRIGVLRQQKTSMNGGFS